MIACEIMLPPHAPEEYLDRAALWNAVEKCEKHPKAQLAYSFDIAMQNELTMEENIELARKFVQEQFVANGMIADLAFHTPDKEKGGIPNPHFHVMTTMRPLNPDGTWGQKQRREYILDEDGNRVRDKNGDYVFNAVHTTDWHEPETLERWREAWSVLCNGKFEEKGLFLIIGDTGAGKTTMVKLLMRFYDVNSGAILLNDHNIKDFNRRELRDAFGMVLQDTWLFKGPIMENIRYGRLNATDEEVIAAAKAARAHHFIQTLPGGYQMELNEDASNVSQGQKQLLTIARAILADNKILILDEATSSVDTRTEIEIQKAMDNLMKGRTSFIIAHRLSTIRDADLILVMKDGDIIEQGNHEELLAKNGFYANLYNSQFEDVVA